MTSPLRPHHDRSLLLAAGFFALSAVTILIVTLLLTGGSDQQDTAPTVAENDVVEGDAKLYVTTMTHMEGRFTDDRDQEVFLDHVSDLRSAMDLFDEYGVKLTVESEKSFAEANTIWDLNFMREIVDRGHGVGTHADGGAETNPRQLSYYVRLFETNKQLIDDLVGAENNRGLSGGIGAYNWVEAASRAGFEYMDGIVGFAYLSMDEAVRPDGWTDEYIREHSYHDPAPVDFTERVQFIPVKNADDFIADDDAILTLASAEIGEFASLSEGRENCSGVCQLTTEDADVFIEAVRDAEEVRLSLNVPVKVNMHIPPSLYDTENEDIFRYLLDGLAELEVEYESLVFATQGQSYDGYQAWKSTR